MNTIVYESMMAIRELALLRRDLLEEIERALIDKWDECDFQVWSVEDVDVALGYRELDHRSIDKETKIAVLHEAIHAESVYEMIFDGIGREIDDYLRRESEKKGG